MNLRVCLLVSAALLIVAGGCSKERSKGSDGSSMYPLGDEAAMGSDLQMVDDYLSKWDRFADGKNELVPLLREKKNDFEAALTRLLKAKDKRAPARMIFYPVVQVGGAIPVDSDLGKAAAAILGPDFPVTTSKEGQRTYFSGDLFFWWQDNGRAYEAYPLLDEWSKRDFAQRVVIPMYKSACKRN